jgi:hypothetical protein
VLQLLVAHAKAQLDQTSKVEVGTGEAGDATQGEAAELLCNSSEIKPIGNALAVTREMYHLANSMDLLRPGELSKLGHVLAGRFMSLHQSVIHGSWELPGT